MRCVYNRLLFICVCEYFGIKICLYTIKNLIPSSYCLYFKVFLGPIHLRDLVKLIKALIYTLKILRLAVIIEL